jgi:N-acetylmuramoyl-L-alanine amidase CwlA
MPIKIIEDLIPTSLPTRSGRKITPQFITIHNTDNDKVGAGAAAHNKYVRGSHAVGRKVSWHFTVDDKAIFQHLPTGERGLHAGTSEGNDKSVGIEICMNSDMDVKKGYNQAADLVAYLVERLKLKFPACMKQHSNWSGKNCPSVLRSGGQVSWKEFLDLCRARIESPRPLTERVERTLEAAERAEWAHDDEATILESIEASMMKHWDGEQVE